VNNADSDRRAVHVRPELAGDLFGSIRAAGVDDNDLVENSFDRR
jgi:hypothetical protein